MQTPAPIVLAVQDDEVDAPLAFALDEARRHGCGIRLVGYDEALLDRIADRIAERDTEVAVGVETVRGAPVRAVLDASADARLVVVRRRDLLHLIRALTAADGVLPTTWTDPPVACVPRDWVPAPADDRPATVGVEDPADTEAMLERARALCGDLSLEPVHASHARAGADLVARSLGSRVLVLGRNPADLRGGTRLGRTSRTALHGSACPVVLLPPRPESITTWTGRGPRGATASGRLSVDVGSRAPSPGGGPRRRLGSPARPTPRVGRGGRRPGGD